MSSTQPYRYNLKPFVDERGIFTRLFEPSFFRTHIPKFHVENINSSFNPAIGTLRGLHYQKAPSQETKIILCLSGKIFDVAVNVDPLSPDYLKHYSTILSPEDPAAFIIPRDHAHGFITLEPDTHVIYLVDTPYDPSAESSLFWNDPLLDITWPIQPRIISRKDQSVPLLPIK